MRRLFTLRFFVCLTALICAGGAAATGSEGLLDAGGMTKIDLELTTRPMTLREIFPPATFPWVSEKVRSGQSTVLVVVDETPMPLAA
jgi:hypothetical protein